MPDVQAVGQQVLTNEISADDRVAKATIRKGYHFYFLRFLCANSNLLLHDCSCAEKS